MVRSVKSRRRIVKFLLLFLLSLSSSLQAVDLILTGQIIASESQHFVTPWTSNWNIQLKWMPDEGEIVKKGDLVVVFDTANIESEIEQQESALRLATEQAREKILKLEQEVIDSNHGLTESELRNKLAQLEAGIPVDFQTRYEFESAQFELTKAYKTLELAKIKLTSKQQELTAEIKKQQLEISRIEEVLKKKNLDLSKLHLYADQDGPVLHAMHPWHGTKIAVGQNVQTRWRVASIAGTSGSKVQAWVNEVDWPMIHQQQAVMLAADAYPAISFPGTITKVSQQAEEKQEWGNASYYELEIDIDELPKVRLIPGMSIQVRVIKQQGSIIASGDSE